MKTVLLSFDLEEFDMPLEYGRGIQLPEQIAISHAGTKVILDILREQRVTATFFTTVVFAKNVPELIQEIHHEGHEIASHGYYHSSFQNSHLAESKRELENITGSLIAGFRMPRMMATSDHELRKAGYTYNSSLNPIYLPGRYNNFFKPRVFFRKDNITQIPASVSPVIRIPLFWLSFHNFPLWLYKMICSQTIDHDGYLNIYFHPWEFTDLKNSKYGLPSYVSKNSGTKMHERFSRLIHWMKKQNYSFKTINEFVNYHCLTKKD